jgi:hypothetical protein
MTVLSARSAAIAAVELAAGPDCRRLPWLWPTDNETTAWILSKPRVAVTA